MFILPVYWLLCAIAQSAQEKTTEEPIISGSALYDGAQVWKVELQTPSDVKIIQSLINNEDISIWKLTPKEAQFLVHMEKKLKVHQQLTNRDLNHTVLIMDVQRRLEDLEIEPGDWDHKALRRGHRMSWGKYPTVEVVHEYMNYLTKNYPSVCTQKAIGKSFENETIKMVTISNGNPKNKAILLIAGAHAREWIAITSALLVMREIVTKFDNQPKFMQDKDWHIIPLLNPDGYRYSYQHDRFWRKNRSINRYSNCLGVDLNRNFDSGWVVQGVTERKPCGELYSGRHAFSEPETIALRDMVQKLKRKSVVAMVDLHSFGQSILYPWSHKPHATADHSLLNATAAEMSKAMLQFKGHKYTFGQTYHKIYPATGSILDWMYSAGIRLSYVIEGRDTGAYGFLMPAMYIQEAGEEMLTAVSRLAKVLDTQLIARGVQNSPWF